MAPATRAVHTQGKRVVPGRLGPRRHRPPASAFPSELQPSRSWKKNRAETNALRLHGERAVVGQVGVQTRQGAKVRQPMQRIMRAGEMKREITRGSYFLSVPFCSSRRTPVESSRRTMASTRHGNPDYHRRSRISNSTVKIFIPNSIVSNLYRAEPGWGTPSLSIAGEMPMQLLGRRQFVFGRRPFPDQPAAKGEPTHRSCGSGTPPVAWPHRRRPSPT